MRMESSSRAAMGTTRLPLRTLAGRRRMHASLCRSIVTQNIENNLRTRSSRSERVSVLKSMDNDDVVKGDMVVAYQGVPGAYSEMAANAACPGYRTMPCEQFETAFEALTQWMAERAVLPVENSLGGSIHAVFDLLQRYRLHIVGETLLEVKHCLLALPGVEKKDIKKVLSHPQALAQTEGYVRKMRGVKREAVDDTAGAAKYIAENDIRDAAAVASKKAAELYGLEILDEGIQDMQDNLTRFVVLSRDPVLAGNGIPEDYKTSILFSLEEGPGVLFKALSVFALRDIDLTKIESRPLRTNPLVLEEEDLPKRFNYLFYVDFIGNLNEVKCQNALRHLQEFAPFVRVLGSYPRYKSPV
eukprot:jgi/Picsp_1/2613/NSC_00843-R1_arogenate prephenate dehydratase